MPHPLQPLVRHAFAAGFATSPAAAITERTRAACTAACATAVEHHSDPDILEVTVHLGRLEGLWATLFQRREQLIGRYTQSVTEEWRLLHQPRRLRDALHRFRAEAGIAETDDDQHDFKAAAIAAARLIVQDYRYAPGWAALIAAIRNALAAGRAEGIAEAVAIAAARARRDGVDWDATFDRAYQQMGRLGDLWDDADAWAARMTSRAATDLSRILADEAEDDSDIDDMEQAAGDALDEPPAIGFTIDWAVTAAAVAAAQGFYQAQGAQTVDWITVGDGRVCITCDDNETRSPWPIDQVPPAPAHPLCRCILSADIDTDRLSGWFPTT